MDQPSDHSLIFHVCENLFSACVPVLRKQYGHSLEEYVQHLKEKSIKKRERLIQRKKERGEEYYTPQCVRQIYYAKQRLAKNRLKRQTHW